MIWRWIDFYLFPANKSTGGEGRCSGYSLGSFAPFQFSKRAAREAAEFSRGGVEQLLGVIGAARLECGEPAAEAAELIRRQLRNNFCDFFDFHVAQYSTAGAWLSDGKGWAPAATPNL